MTESQSLEDQQNLEAEKKRYEQIQSLFLEALRLEPGSDRAAWVERQSNYPIELKKIALSMLQADEEMENRSSSRGLPKTELSPTLAQHVTSAKMAVGSLPQLENYEILELIDRGGMGVVYKARQLRPSRLVAIKMIRAGSFASEMEIARFFTEAEAASQLDNEAVVPVYELGEVNGEPFIAMKYIEGENLERRLKANSIPLPAFLNLFLLVCRAVSGAHQKGIIHRDIKPSNILVDQASGRPWIIDFGIAKYLEKVSDATAAGDLLGTPGYMAPEQAFGNADTATRATDVYGLGAILYRGLTGRPPIQTDSNNLASAIQLIREHDIVAPRSIRRSIPRALNTICMKCLETDASQRYCDAGELASDLQRYLSGEAIQAKPLNWTRRLHRWARHRPGLAVTLGSIVVFYSYYLFIRGFALYDDSPFDYAAFDTPATIAAASIALGAWLWQSFLNRTQGAAWVLYAWVSFDIVLLTLLLFWADSANSSLVLLYHVFVAGSILRCRTDLVAYVTIASMLGYVIHLIHLGITSTNLPDITTYVPTLLSLAIIGAIQYFSLRKSAASFESQGAAGHCGVD